MTFSPFDFKSNKICFGFDSTKQKLTKMTEWCKCWSRKKRVGNGLGVGICVSINNNYTEREWLLINKRSSVGFEASKQTLARAGVVVSLSVASIERKRPPFDRRSCSIEFHVVKPSPSTSDRWRVFLFAHCALCSSLCVDTSTPSARLAFDKPCSAGNYIHKPIRLDLNRTCLIFHARST